MPARMRDGLRSKPTQTTVSRAPGALAFRTSCSRFASPWFLPPSLAAFFPSRGKQGQGVRAHRFLSYNSSSRTLFLEIFLPRVVPCEISLVVSQKKMWMNRDLEGASADSIFRICSNPVFCGFQFCEHFEFLSDIKFSRFLVKPDLISERK